MNATSTFFSVLLAHCLYTNDKITPNKAIGCLLGFLGLTVVNVKGLDDFSFALMVDGFIVIAAFILSAATSYGKRIFQTMDPIVMTGYQLAIGGIILTLTGYLSGGSLSVHG